MADREKVLKSLEICFTPNANCKECPYDVLGAVPHCTKALGADVIPMLKSDKNLIENQARIINDLGDILKEKEETIKDLRVIVEDSKNQVKTYGKLYSVSPKAVLEKREDLENAMYVDICKCLIENGVLVLHSEGNAFEITYGWKLKGVKIY